MISFFVPGEPRGKGRPRFLKTGRTYTPANTADAERSIGWEARKAMAGQPPLEGPLFLLIAAYFEVPASWSKKKKEAARWKTSKPDLDNLVKIVKDALNKIVWLDDAQVVQLFSTKTYSMPAGIRVEVSLAAPFSKIFGA